MSFISRIGQKKQNYEIKLSIKKIGANVDKDGELYVVWKRGPQTDKTKKYEVNDIEVDAEANDVFVRVSSFYSTSTTVVPKGCDFQVFFVDQNEKEKMIGFVLNHDMSPFVDKSSQAQHIEIVN